jgi:hypothetical protein
MNETKADNSGQDSVEFQSSALLFCFQMDSNELNNPKTGECISRELVFDHYILNGQESMNNNYLVKLKVNYFKITSSYL